MSDSIEVLQAMARRAGRRLDSAQRNLDDAQRLRDDASMACSRACSALGDAIEEESDK